MTYQQIASVRPFGQARRTDAPPRIHSQPLHKREADRETHAALGVAVTPGRDPGYHSPLPAPGTVMGCGSLDVHTPRPV